MRAIALAVSVLSIRSRLVLTFCFFFLDIGAFALACISGYFLFNSAQESSLWLPFASAGLIGGCAFTVFAFSVGLYDWRTFRQHIQTPHAAFISTVFSFGFLLIIGFLLQITSDFERGALIFWFAAFSIYIAVSRIVIASQLFRPRNRGMFARKAVVLGASEHGQAIVDHLQVFNADVQVIGFLDDRTTRIPVSVWRCAPSRRDKRGRAPDPERGVEIVIISLPSSACQRIDNLLEILGCWPVDVYMAPNELALRYADRPVLRLFGMPVLSLKRPSHQRMEFGRQAR